MHIPKRHVIAGFVFAFLTLALFAGTVSADDGSDGTTVSTDTAITVETSSSADTTVVRDSGDEAVDGDPYFKVGTTTFRYAEDCTGLTNCTESSTPISDALNAIAGGLKPSDRKLYVEDGTYNESVTIKGLTGLTSLIGSGSDGAVINGDVDVENQMTGFTLSGFDINGGVVFLNNTGTITLTDLNISNPDGDGININYQAGAIVLTNVIASDNDGYGANLDNDNPEDGTITTWGVYPVMVTNSEFNNNFVGGVKDAASLDIESNGIISVKWISASNNKSDGMDVGEDRTALVSVSNSVFNGNSSTLDEWGMGLYIYGGGPVMLQNVTANGNVNIGICIGGASTVVVKNATANDNGNNGLDINNFLPLSTSGALSIFDSTFNDNHGYGLIAYTMGNILVSYVNASGNSSDGAYLGTCWYADDNVCEGKGTVTILNPYKTAAHFDSNEGNGLYIESAAAVTITGISASENEGYGLYVENDYGMNSSSGVFQGVIAPVTINNVAGLDDVSEFSFNLANGICILTNGAITINGTSGNPIQVDANLDGGIYIESDNYEFTAPVTIKFIETLGNAYADSSYVNIYIANAGNVTLTSVSSLDYYDSTSSILYIPQGGGIWVNGSGKGNVIITNGSSSNSKYGEGYYIITGGSVVMTNVWVSGNGGYGVYIDNCASDSVTGECTSTAAVSILGTSNGFDDNGSTGLYIYTLGNVTLTNLEVAENGGNGIYIGSYDDGVFSGNAVKITNLGDMSGNGNDAIDIANFGLVYISGGTVGSDYGNGIVIDNTSAATPQPVTLINISVEGTAATGIRITSSGLVTLNNVSSEGNTERGVRIDNHSGNANVIITGKVCKNTTSSGSFNYPCGSFSSNGDDGIYIRTDGTVTLSNIKARDNDGDGIVISNSGGDGKAVTLSLVYVIDSGNIGLDIRSNGPITLKTISVVGSGEEGAVLDNYSAGGVYAVSVTDGRFSYNEVGLSITTAGNVTLTGVDAIENFIRDYNIGTLSDTGITIYSGMGTETSYGCDYNSCVNTENASATWHFSLSSDQTVTVQISAKFSGTVELYSTSDGSVIKSVDFTSNENYSSFTSDSTLAAGDYYVVIEKNIFTAYGTYTLSLNDSDENHGEDITSSGVDVELYGNGTVTVKKSAANSTNDLDYNGDCGLAISTILYHFDEEGNFTGADVWAGTISIANINASDNAYAGVHIDGAGAVTVTNVSADYNGRYGMYVDNTSGTSGVTYTASVASEFIGNGEYGVNVYSNGAIKVTATKVLTVSDNGTGFELENYSGGYLSPITVAGVNVASLNHGSIVASNNSHDGLWVASFGAVTVNNVYSERNVSAGIVVSGCSLEGFPNSGASSVSISNSKVYFTQSDEGSGISVSAQGTVTLTNLVSEGNGRNGVSIWNATLATIRKIYARNNENYGIYVIASGNVVLDSIDATNSVAGTYIETTNGSVTLLGSYFTSHFDGSDSNGLSISAVNGSVTLNKFTASDNAGYGVRISDSTKNLIVNNGVTNNNNYGGLAAELANSAVINGLTAIGNGEGNEGHGLKLTLNSSTGKITIANSLFMDNEGYGIWLLTPVKPTILNTFYMGNDSDDDGNPNVLIGASS